MSEEVKLSKSAKDKEKQAQDEAKLKTLETVLGKIEKTYGKGAVMNMAARPTTDVNVIPTGSINLDHALGVGGYPRGRIIEIYGPESSGKTTLAIHAIAEVQKQGGKAIIIDAEHAFDPSYAEALGVDMDSLYISQPDNGEQALISPSRSSALVPSTWSSSTPSQPWCLSRRSRAIWVRRR